MAEEIKSGSIQLRRDTLANWEGSTVILRPGEVGIAIDQDPLIIKVGNGYNGWSDLSSSYLSGIKGARVSGQLANITTDRILEIPTSMISASWAVSASRATSAASADTVTGGLDYIQSSWSGSASSRLAGTASYALIAESVRASASLVVDTASYAHNAGTASVAHTASYVAWNSVANKPSLVSSSWTGSANSHFAGTASFAVNAGLATSASRAVSASRADSAASAVSASRATSASRADSARSADTVTGGLDYVASSWTGSANSQFAGTASFATVAQSVMASGSLVVDTASYAHSAGRATSASRADSAASVAWANITNKPSYVASAWTGSATSSFAGTASRATSASRADSAASAASAANATSASRADSAAEANKAYLDGDGQTITQTYVLNTWTGSNSSQFAGTASFASKSIYAIKDNYGNPINGTYVPYHNTNDLYMESGSRVIFRFGDTEEYLHIGKINNRNAINCVDENFYIYSDGGGLYLGTGGPNSNANYIYSSDILPIGGDGNGSVGNSDARWSEVWATRLDAEVIDAVDINANFIRVPTVSVSTVRTATIYATDTIYANGDVVAGYTSDRRLKKDIQTITPDKAHEVLCNLNPVEFEWNDKMEDLTEGHRTGKARSFVADEFLKVIPNAGQKIYNEEYDSIYIEQVIPYLVAGYQRQQQEIEELKREIKELKARL